MTARTGAAAVSYAQSRVGTYLAAGHCQAFVRTVFNVANPNNRYPDATTSWRLAAARHASRTINPPRGVPVWFGGLGYHGHVGFSLGSGYMIGTDYPRRSHIGSFPIATLERNWGCYRLGWAETFNGVRIWTPPRAAAALVDLSALLNAAHHDAARTQGFGLYEAGTLRVERALQAEGLLAAAYAGDGYWGSVTTTAYRAWQHRLGYSGSSADGLPGMTSLSKLGARHSFRVIA